MAERHVEDILYDESFKNKKCDKMKIKFYFASMNSGIIIVLATLEWFNISSSSWWNKLVLYPTVNK